MFDRTEPRWIDEFYESGLYEREYSEYLADGERNGRQAELIIRELDIDGDSVVLDLACGGGRHALLVAGRAAQVVGIDRSERAIEVAQAQATTRGVRNARFLVRDMRDLDEGDEFDSAYSFYTSWGYYSDEENFDVLLRVARCLRPGGRFLIELASRDALVRCENTRNFGYLDDGTVVTLESSFEPATGRSSSRRTYHRGGERRTIEIIHHVPSPDDLARMLESAGLVEVELKDGESGDRLTLDSERVLAVGRRPAIHR